MMKNKHEIPLALAFDDVLLLPRDSQIASRSHVSTRSRLSGDLYLEWPIISSNMDTVTMSEMAIAMAKLGGIGFIHRFLPIDENVNEIIRVKRYRSHIIENPYHILYNETIEQSIKEMNAHEVGGLMVTGENGKLAGIITRRDIEGEPLNDLVSDAMTNIENMIYGNPTTTPEEAQKMMHSRRVEKLPLLNEDGLCSGLIVMKDIKKLEENPRATLDSSGKLAVGGSIGVVGDYLERCEALVDAGADVIVLDVAHGWADHVLKAIKQVRILYPDLNLVVGNVATGEGLRAVAEVAGKGCGVRVGIGGGCFAAGTRVLMANGTYKNIENISVGDRVINGEGKAVNVVGAQCTGMKKVMSYNHTQSLNETLVTQDHRHWTGDLNSLSQTSISSKGYANSLKQTNKIDWKPIGDFEKDVFLTPANIDFEMQEKFVIDMREHAVDYTKLNEKEHNIEPDYNLGYLFGAFLGDGTAHLTKFKRDYGSVHFYFNKKELKIAEKVVSCIENITGKTAKINDLDNVYKVSFYSLPWTRLFKEFDKKENKHLPEKYLSNNKEYLKGLYEGLIDSDGYRAKDGRIGFTNTSYQLAELFVVLTKINTGSFPNVDKRPGRPGNLEVKTVCQEVYEVRLNKTHDKRIFENYQIVKPLTINKEESSSLIPVYDIEVDCPTHSFIANNSIVHNSACDTRQVAGSGLPMITSIMDSYQVAKEMDVCVIADGGIRIAADVAKAFGAGAGAAMLGSLLASAKESPGEVVLRDGQRFKTYRGMASREAAVRRWQAEGRLEKLTDDFTPEGIESAVRYNDFSAEKIVQPLIGGLKSGMSYAGAKTISDFHERARFTQITSAGLGESKTHVKDRM